MADPGGANKPAGPPGPAPGTPLQNGETALSAMTNKAFPPRITVDMIINHMPEKPQHVPPMQQQQAPRSAHQEATTSPTEPVQQQKNMSEAEVTQPQPPEPPVCCICGRVGHVALWCVLPQLRVGNQPGGTGIISACVRCNTLEHSVDDCPVIEVEIRDLSPESKTKYLGVLICWGRGNRPPVQSEKWFFLDMLEGYCQSGSIDLIAPVAMYVPWTERFCNAMANNLNTPGGQQYSDLADNYAPIIKDRIIKQQMDIRKHLPNDLFWSGMTVIQAIEMHRAGAFDHLRQMSASTRAQHYDLPHSVGEKMLGMLLLHAGVFGQPSGCSDEDESGSMWLGILDSDEIPQPAPGVPGLPFDAESFMDPGAFKAHPTGMVATAKDGSETRYHFLQFWPDADVLNLRNMDPILYQRIKRAVNNYRLRKVTADTWDPEDLFESFLAHMARTTRARRIEVVFRRQFKTATKIKRRRRAAGNSDSAWRP